MFHAQVLGNFRRAGARDAGRLLVGFASLLLAAGCAQTDSLAEESPAGGLDEAALQEMVVTNAAEIGLATLVARGCAEYDFDEAEKQRRSLAVSAMTAKFFKFDAEAMAASPLLRRFENFASDPEIKSQVARKMAEISVEYRMHPDDPASMCQGGAKAVEDGESFGPLLAPRS